MDAAGREPLVRELPSICHQRPMKGDLNMKVTTNHQRPAHTEGRLVFRARAGRPLLFLARRVINALDSGGALVNAVLRNFNSYMAKLTLEWVTRTIPASSIETYFPCSTLSLGTAGTASGEA